MYYFHSDVGNFEIARNGARWQATFNAVVLSDFASAEEAAIALGNGSGYVPALHELFRTLALPADLRGWRQQAVRPEDQDEMLWVPGAGTAGDAKGPRA